MFGESCDVFAIQVLVVQTFAVSCVKIQPLTHLFVKVHIYLDQETAKERSSNQAVTCYYHSNHYRKRQSRYLPTYKSKKQQANLFVYFYAILLMLTTSRETVITWSTFYVVWADSTKESNPGLPTKIWMFLGVTLAEICLKMHYFCNKI